MPSSTGNLNNPSSQRHEGDITFVGDGTRQLGKILRPVAVPFESGAVDALGRLLQVEAFHCGQDLSGNELQTRAQFKSLFPLTHQPSKGIFWAARGWVVCAIGPPPINGGGIISE